MSVPCAGPILRNLYQNNRRISQVQSGLVEKLAASRLVERLRQVGNDVVLVLDAEREADITVGDPGLQLLLGRQLGVGRARWVDREAAGVTDIGDMVEHLQRVDETPPSVA